MVNDSEIELVHLSPSDNVACLPCSADAGVTVGLDGSTWQLAASAGPGFKVAITTIAKGEQVLKFGAPIGSATKRISAGDIVHLDNLQSDYIPTYTLDEGSKYGI